MSCTYCGGDSCGSSAGGPSMCDEIDRRVIIIDDPVRDSAMSEAGREEARRWYERYIEKRKLENG